MNHSLSQVLQQRLQQRHAQQQYRQVATRSGLQGTQVTVAGQALLNFSSNDYLNLAGNPSLIAKVQQQLSYTGLGSGASHLICGHSEEHEALCERLQNFIGAPRVMLFSCGYMANLALLTTLFERADLIVQDKLNHASLIDAGRFSDATHRRFRHLDNESLRQQLRGEFRLTGVVTDGVFSMDGDSANVAQYLAMPEMNNKTLIVDDAHGFGVVGHRGVGVTEGLWQDHSEQLILMGTFGKALGSAGAFVAGSAVVIDALQQFARPYVYTTALSPVAALTTLVAIESLSDHPQWLTQLQQNIAYFRYAAESEGLPLMPSTSAIQPLLVGDESSCLTLGEKLRQQGFWVGVIRPPTVPQNQCRLRITITREHTEPQIKQLVTTLAKLIAKNKD